MASAVVQWFWSGPAVGIYWAVAGLLGGTAVGVYYHSRELRLGLSTPATPYVLTAGALMVGAFVLPAITSGDLQQVVSTFAVAAGYLVFAWLDRSRTLAGLAALMAVVPVARPAERRRPPRRGQRGRRRRRHPRRRPGFPAIGVTDAGATHGTSRPAARRRRPPAGPPGDPGRSRPGRPGRLHLPAQGPRPHRRQPVPPPGGAGGGRLPRADQDLRGPQAPHVGQGHPDRARPRWPRRWRPCGIW